ncbi:putative protein of unknown function DUF303, acetylesterase [Cynara cardunculus var. scolymus]|uniref:Sialate O-acetylesterase domain-containing protein n=1 Tax=Cynara cardunculus var. scolymus TaxID=59895 RepID=A0A118JYA4_CYNCS|nr:putative protein of unknown function DUF303, acetylesterase [Cynara cardunculus var. scolymus]
MKNVKMFPLFLSYACLVISAVTRLTNAAAGKSIFLLAGQSNMSGRGGIVNLTWDGYIPPESSSNPAILRLTANLNWELAVEPLHRDIDVAKVCGVGPAMAFANSLLKKDSSIGVVGLVPCAIGGTNISQWVRGGDLYNQLIRRADAAVSGGGTIGGLLWYQGESDTLTLEDAEATVDAMGLRVQEPERLHLTTPSQVSLGKMLTNAFLQLCLPWPSKRDTVTATYRDMLLLYLSYAYLFISSAVTVANAAAGKSIFLLAGQSNMAGRGGVVNDTWDNYVPPESSPDLAILRLSADLNWQLATEPLHRDIDTNKVCGVGPGMAFASSLLRKDSSVGVVGLVPCAVGGTNISEWGRGGDLYKQLIRRAEAALEVGGTVRGLLWFQGESDTVSREDAELYKTRLQNFILHVALASGEGPYIEMVREAQLGMDMVNLRTIDAKGLNLEPDGLHLTTPSQVSLGNMLANAFIQTRPSAIITPNTASTIMSQNFLTHFLSLLLLVINASFL